MTPLIEWVWRTVGNLLPGSSAAPGRASARSRYIDRWGLCGKDGELPDKPGPQPFVARDVRMWGFVFEGTHRNLEALCGRYLNHAAAPVVYHPVPPYWVFVTCTDARKLAARHAPFSHLGFDDEKEVAFWVMTAAVNGSAVVPDVHLAMFVPYIFVDNPLAISQGREIYGFPKEMAWFDGFPPAGKELSHLTVRAQAVTRFGRDVEASPLPVLEVKKRGAGSASPLIASAWRTFTDAAEAIGARLPVPLPLHVGGIRLAPGLLAQFLPPQRMVFLKQVQDARDGRYASYQALIEADATVSAFRSGGYLPGRYVLTLHNRDSHPVAADLGLKHGQQALFSYCLDFDFDLEAGEVIWEA